MLLVCPPNNMPSTTAFIPPRPPPITSNASKNNSIKSVFAMTGAAKRKPATRNIINGRNGFFCDSWFNRKKEKAERISELVSIFEKEGNAQHPFPNGKFKLENGHSAFNADYWKNSSPKNQQEILMQYRLAYLAYADVNWCEALGTVLANDEVINGVSYRGGH